MIKVSTRITSLLTLGISSVCVTAAYAQTIQCTVAERLGCTFEASAYIDPSLLPSSKYNPAERLDLYLTKQPATPYKWDFTLPDNPDYAYTGLTRGYGSPSYQTEKNATIRATLRQFDTYEEKVTFKDLDLVPSGGRTPRFLALKEPRSITTPSGITMTLLPLSSPMNGRDMTATMNGNIDAIYIPIQVTPNSKEVGSLPDSPLFRKYKRPVTIKIDVTSRDDLVSYAADNTYTGIKVSVPHLKTVTHLDELTFVLRQRTNLQSVPISIEVPISKPVMQKVAHQKLTQKPRNLPSSSSVRISVSPHANKEFSTAGGLFPMDDDEDDDEIAVN